MYETIKELIMERLDWCRLDDLAEEAADKYREALIDDLAEGAEQMLFDRVYDLVREDIEEEVMEELRKRVEI